jgi:glyceraldehyde 3-phosphate dehydrogenase
MELRIGINGFGRIGRNAARIILSSKHTVLAAINSNSDASSHAYLLQHDSVHGTLPQEVLYNGTTIIIESDTISCFQKKNPQEIPWEQAGVDLVLECTGKFRTSEEAEHHLGGTVKHVVISAPVKDQTPTYVMGVNHEKYKKEPVVSNSSCTTNCITTTLKVLDDVFGVMRGSMTTVHAVTDSQNILDNSHKKEVRSRRSALVNLIPATSGSASDVAKLFPHLAGLLPCRSIRVPVPTVSLIELVVQTKKKTTVADVNRAFEQAEKSQLHGILSVAREELVSTDYIGSPYSAIVDPFLTDVVDGTLVHVTAWYDNEWGYANRLVELARYISK